MLFKKKSPAPTPRRQTAVQPSKNKAVFSYYQNRDEQPDGSKSRAKPSFLDGLKQRIKHLPTVIAGLILLACLLFALSLSTTPRVSVVNDQSKTAAAAFLRPAEEYRQAAQGLLSKSVLSGNKITLDTASVEQQLQEQFPEITSVAVVVPLISRTPVIYVQVAEPVLLLESGPSKYIIDEKGRALIAADKVGDIGSLSLIPVKDAAQLTIQPGSQVLTGKDVTFMRTVRDQLTAKGLKVSRMELPAQASEVHVYLEGKPYFIKLTTTSDPLQQVGAYLALNQHLEGKKVVPSSYVDVRVAERVYYK